MAEYIESLRRELESLDVSGPLTTVYLGGGTPSRLGAPGIRDVLALIRSRFALEPGAEVTIEANPDDVAAGDALGWIDAGVNRISLGVQSFDDNVLKWMHRVHDSRAAVDSFEILRAAGFENISIDLIFALPESSQRSWQRDLEMAIGMGPQHISLYGLTVEPSTPLSRWTESGNVTVADEDRYAEEFLLADRLTRAAGYEHYEVSNFALPGMRSRHNSAYWSGAKYVGVGPSAHSFDGEKRSWNVKHYAEWVSRLSRNELVVAGSERLTQANRLAEKVYLGLRTHDGLPVSSSYDKPIRSWTENGWARVDGDVIRLTSEGWLRLDSLAAALTAV